MNTPIRIQRRRVKGWKAPENTVSVCRPGKYGNPFKIGETFTQPDGEDIILDAQQCVNLYEQSIKMYGEPVNQETIIKELKGKNLMCFCSLSSACHGDVLLKIANSV